MHTNNQAENHHILFEYLLHNYTSDLPPFKDANFKFSNAVCTTWLYVSWYTFYLRRVTITHPPYCIWRCGLANLSYTESQEIPLCPYTTRTPLLHSTFCYLILLRDSFIVTDPKHQYRPSSVPTRTSFESEPKLSDSPRFELSL